MLATLNIYTNQYSTSKKYPLQYSRICPDHEESYLQGKIKCLWEGHYMGRPNDSHELRRCDRSWAHRQHYSHSVREVGRDPYQ
jgi:hypothetical protein